MRTKMTMGNRYEGGWSYGGRGVNISYFQLGKQEQTFGTTSEFAVNSPTQTFTFETSLGGQVVLVAVAVLVVVVLVVVQERRFS